MATCLMNKMTWSLSPPLCSRSAAHCQLLLWDSDAPAGNQSVRCQSLRQQCAHGDGVGFVTRSTAELAAVLAALEQDGGLLVVPPRLLGGTLRPTEVWFA